VKLFVEFIVQEDKEKLETNMHIELNFATIDEMIK